MERCSFDLKKAKKRTLKIDVLRTDGDTQPRDGIDQSVVNEYAECYKAKQKMPPVHCVHDGSNFWLTDGFHRRFGAGKAGLAKLECLVVPGTLEDARWYSYAANQGHGLMRSVEDKVRAVKAALKHPNAAGMSDRLIAEHVGVSHPMVIKYRELVTVTSSDAVEPMRTGKDGKKRPAKPNRKPRVDHAQEPAADDADAPEEDECTDDAAGQENDACNVASSAIESLCEKLLASDTNLTRSVLAAVLENIAERIRCVH